MIRNYEALWSLMRDRRRTPFAWGKRAHDCISFAAAAVEAQTGRDLLADVDADWNTEIGARRVVRRLGGMAAIVSSRLGEIAPAMAQRGDIAAYKDEKGRLQLAVVDGELLKGPGIDGLVSLPRSMMVRAWSAVDFRS